MMSTKKKMALSSLSAGTTALRRKRRNEARSAIMITPRDNHARRAFEEWAEINGYDVLVEEMQHFIGSSNAYYSNATQTAWQAFQVGWNCGIDRCADVVGQAVVGIGGEFPDTVIGS